MSDTVPNPHVEIYTSMFCGFCIRAKALLDQKGVDYVEYDVMAEPGIRKAMAARADDNYEVPQIFINNEHIGGCNELMMLEMAGGLDAKLTPA